MCLLIHKAQDADLPRELLDSAAEYNPHGFGIMAFAEDGGMVVRRTTSSDKDRLHRLYDRFQHQECVIHLRYGTSGNVDRGNTHPIRITRDIYMAHNGTINLPRPLPERSDTWHLVNHYLKPVLQRRPEQLHEPFFQDFVISLGGEHNKFVFMDARERRTVVINREKGFEIDGLWLSNTRWFDATRFHWYTPALPFSAGIPGAHFAI